MQMNCTTTQSKAPNKKNIYIENAEFYVKYEIYLKINRQLEMNC